MRIRLLEASVVAVGLLCLLPAIAQATAPPSPGISAAGTVAGTFNGSPVVVQVAAVQGCAPGTSTFVAMWPGNSFREGAAGQSEFCSNYDGSGRPQSLQFSGSGANGTLTGGDLEGPTSPSNPNTMSFTIHLTGGGVLAVTNSTPGPFQGAPGRVQPYQTSTSGLEFIQQPTNSVVNQSISPAVTVQLINSTASGVLVTIGIGSNPGASTLSGMPTEPTVNGVATFSNLSLNNPQNGYTLTASSLGLNGATSSTFGENNSQVPCLAGAGCTDTIDTSTSSFQVDVGSGSTAATLSESVDVGTPQNGDPGCSGYRPRSVDWYEFNVTPADGKTYDRTKTITWTVFRVSADGFEVCYGAPYDFQTGFGDNGAIFAPAGTLPDGTIGFVGLLDSCDALGDAQSSNPCWTSIDSTDSGTVATVQIPAGLSGDPFMGRG